MKIAQERNPLSMLEVNHPFVTAPETKREEIVPQENDLLKVVVVKTTGLGGTLLEDVHQKITKGPALPGDTPVIGKDQGHPLEDITGDTQDLLQGDTGETQGPDHLQESRNRRPRKSTLTFKKEERYLTIRSVRYSGTVFSGWPRHRPRLKMTSMSKSRERVRRLTKRNWPNPKQ